MVLIETRSRDRQYYLNHLARTEEHLLQSALQDISEDGRIVDKYIAASLNNKFGSANFARDALRIIRDSQLCNPELCGIVIRSCIRHMAFRRDDSTEAQVGKIHHEHRYRKGARSPDFIEIFNKEMQIWTHQGDKDHQQFTYYGAVDTTPDFFNAVAREARIHPEILKDKVYNEDLGRMITIAKGAKAAIHWVTDTILYGPIVNHTDRIKSALRERQMDRFLPFYENQVLRRVDNIARRARELRRTLSHYPREYLLESQRVNGLGIFFQNITDGGLSTMHSSEGREGLLGNYHQPIAYLEVQISAINALENAASLYPKKAHFYKNLAQKMRESTLRQFYMADKKYFAAAVDRDEVTGKRRQVETFSIMGASILNSDLFDNMPHQQKQAYLQPIIERLFSDDFLTDVGIRTKAKHHAFLITHPDDATRNAAEYQGSWTVWPVLNEDIIFGLRRQGFHDLAEQLENRLVNFVHANSNAEYAFVVPGTVMVQGQPINLDGTVAQFYKTKEEFDALSDEEKEKFVDGKTIIYVCSPYPQGDQLWTATAVKRIMDERERGLSGSTDTTSWQYGVEKIIFQQQNWKSVDLLSPEELAAEKEKSPYCFIIDQQESARIEEKLREISEQKRRGLR